MRMGPQPGVRTRAPVVKGAEKRRDSSPAQTIEAGRDSEGPRTLALTPFVDGLTLMIMSAIDSVRKSAAVRAEEWCAPQRVLVQRGIVFRKCSRQVRRSSSGDAAVCQRTYRPKVPKESPVPQFKSGTVRRAVASDDDAIHVFGAEKAANTAYIPGQYPSTVVYTIYRRERLPGVTVGSVTRNTRNWLSRLMPASYGWPTETPFVVWKSLSD
jgi:hypothetical protein